MPQILKRLVRVCAAVAALLGALPGMARAQTPHQLVSILTDQSILDNASDKFGIPVAVAANDAGDMAFIGLRGSGLYYRKANDTSISRAIQFGDEVPGLTGSRLSQLLTPVLMNANGLVAVRADVYITSRLTHAILTFDGTTLRTIATGLDTAPGTGGQKYERAMSLYGLNNTGDVLFGSTLVPLGTTNTAQPTLFLSVGGGAPARITGYGDVAPGTGGGTFTTATGSGTNALNDAGQVLFSASMTGGTASTGLFVYKTGSVRKVAAVGDPSPVGGTFSQDFTVTGALLSNAGLVMFVASNSLFMNTEVDGNSTAVAAGSAVPAPMGGTFGTFNNFPALSSAGDAVFFASVTGGSGASGVFRFKSGTGVEVVARVTQAVPGAAGKTFTAFSAASVNAIGTVSLQGNYANGGPGFFQKPAGGALAAVALSGDATPLGGTYIFNGFGSITLANNAIIVRTHIDRGFSFTPGEAHHAIFKFLGGATALMSTGDDLPSGAKQIVRPFFLTAAGSWVGVEYQKAGGRESIGSYNPTTQDGRRPWHRRQFGRRRPAVRRRQHGHGELDRRDCGAGDADWRARGVHSQRHRVRGTEHVGVHRPGRSDRQRRPSVVQPAARERRRAADRDQRRGHGGLHGHVQQQPRRLGRHREWHADEGGDQR